MTSHRVAIMLAGALVLSGSAGCGDDIGGSGAVEVGAGSADLADCTLLASTELRPLASEPGANWFRLSHADVEFADPAGPMPGTMVLAPSERFERLNADRAEHPTVAVKETTAATWREALGRGSSVLLTGSSSAQFDTYLSAISFEVTKSGSVRMLERCAPRWQPVVEELAANHGTDVESLLLEMGDPERASALLDEMDALQIPDSGPSDRAWAERPEHARSMADPDVPPEVAASSVELTVAVEVPEGWRTPRNEVERVCSRSGGVMGVCTSLDGNGRMTAWSVGGAPIEVYLPRDDESEVARLAHLAPPFSARSYVVVAVDAARFPTPDALVASGRASDAASVSIYPTYEAYQAAGHRSPPSTGTPSGR